MTSWSLLLCEGAHDQEFLTCLATSTGQWVHKKSAPAGLPANLRSGTTLFYLLHGNSCLVVANLNGVTKILGNEGKLLVSRQATTARSVGVLLDADDVGATTRRDGVRAHYSSIVQSAALAEHGQVVSSPPGSLDQRRFGLWVAPDGNASGSFDDVVRVAANAKHPIATNICDKFVEQLGNATSHEWAQYRQKAVLASLGQLWRAGNSLASAMQERSMWMDSDLSKQAPFASIADFLKALID